MQRLYFIFLWSYSFIFVGSRPATIAQTDYLDVRCHPGEPSSGWICSIRCVSRFGWARPIRESSWAISASNIHSSFEFHKIALFTGFVLFFGTVPGNSREHLRCLLFPALPGHSLVVFLVWRELREKCSIPHGWLHSNVRPALPRDSNAYQYRASGCFVQLSATQRMDAMPCRERRRFPAIPLLGTRHSDVSNTAIMAGVFRFDRRPHQHHFRVILQWTYKHHTCRPCSADGQLFCSGTSPVCARNSGLSFSIE